MGWQRTKQIMLWWTVSINTTQWMWKATEEQIVSSRWSSSIWTFDWIISVIIPSYVSVFLSDLASLSLHHTPMCTHVYIHTRTREGSESVNTVDDMSTQVQISCPHSLETGTHGIYTHMQILWKRRAMGA